MALAESNELCAIKSQGLNNPKLEEAWTCKI